MAAAQTADAVRQHSPSPASPEPVRPPSRRPDGLSLRRRREGDEAGLVALLGDADFQRNGSTLDVGSPEEVGVFLRSFPPGSFEIVGVVNGTVVAYGGVCPLPGRRKHTGALTVCVHRAHQRRGVGTAVLACLVDTARVMMGLGRLQLTVFVDNARAVTLYRRFGFVTEGRITDFVERPDGLVDAYLMARPTSRPSTMGGAGADAARPGP